MNFENFLDEQSLEQENMQLPHMDVARRCF